MGVVTYDNDRCIGCRYCMYACPFEVPHFEWEQHFALIKCDLCVARLEDGQQPACAATCPTQAIQFGPRQDMLNLAHERIKNEPRTLYQPCVWRKRKWRHFHFLYFIGPFEQLGFPVCERNPSPGRVQPHGYRNRHSHHRHECGSWNDGNLSGA